MRYDSLLVVAHGNSLRGVIKHLKGIPDDRIAALNLPTAVPYVFEFDDALRLVRDYYLGDPEEIRRRAEGRRPTGQRPLTERKRGAGISAKSGPFPIYIPYNSPAIRRTAAPARA